MGGRDGAEVVERLRAALTERLPGLIVWQEREPRRTRLIFPAATGSDYRIIVFVQHGGGRADVVAELVADPELRLWRYRLRASHAGEGGLEEMLAEVLVPLLSRPSRVRQSRGPLRWCFVCEVPDDDAFPALSGAPALRGLGRVPRAPEGERVHHGRGGKRRSG